MKKYTLFITILVVTLLGLSIGVSIVSADEVVAIIPSAQGSNVSEVSPVIVGTNNNETGAIIPNTGSTNTNETGAIIPASIGSNTDEGTLVIETPVTPVVPITGGGSTGASTGSFSNSGRGLVFVSALPASSSFSTTSCPLITDYLKFEGTNNSVQVSKLQIFLKNSEKLNVDVNGIFDQKTENAVKAFQIKYLPSILGPWDATKATGFVYITTVKKINELACASPIVLSANDQSVIEAYKARGTVEYSDSISSEDNNATGTLELGDLTNDDNTAAVGNSSILSRFWNFIVNLFR